MISETTHQLDNGCELDFFGTAAQSQIKTQRISLFPCYSMAHSENFKQRM